MTAFVIRQLTAADAAQYRELRLESLRLHPTAYTTAAEDEINRTLAEFEARMETALCYGGFTPSGEMLGIVCISYPNNSKTGHIGMLWSVYVREAARGTGIARAMMQAVVDAARPRGGSLRLFVTSTNETAHELYKKVGFVDFALEKAALHHEGTYHDGYLMRLDFDPV